jgi:hypothetical protein
MSTVLIPFAGVALLAGVVWWVYRRHPGASQVDGLPWRARLVDWWGEKKASASAREARWSDPPAPGPRETPAAPRPPLPADDPPAPSASGPAVINGIPADHAAALTRIASHEPESDREHTEFMLREAKAFAFYGEAFCAAADNLIHGPGLSQSALKGTFDFADMFGDLSLAANRALKQFSDYYAGPREFVEQGGELPRDGRWLGRDR